MQFDSRRAAAHVPAAAGQVTLGGMVRQNPGLSRIPTSFPLTPTLNLKLHTTTYHSQPHRDSEASSLFASTVTTLERDGQGRILHRPVLGSLQEFNLLSKGKWGPGEARTAFEGLKATFSPGSCLLYSHGGFPDFPICGHSGPLWHPVSRSRPLHGLSDREANKILNHDALLSNAPSTARSARKPSWTAVANLTGAPSPISVKAERPGIPDDLT